MAQEHFARARDILQAGHFIYDLANVHLGEAACLVGKGHLDEADVACDRAIDLSGSRKYKLIHADALNVRAQIELARESSQRARDAAEEAYTLSRECDYFWGQLEAARHLVIVHTRMARVEEAMKFQERVDEWTRRL